MSTVVLSTDDRWRRWCSQRTEPAIHQGMSESDQPSAWGADAAKKSRG